MSTRAPSPMTSFMINTTPIMADNSDDANLFRYSGTTGAPVADVTTFTTPAHPFAPLSRSCLDIIRAANSDQLMMSGNTCYCKLYKRNLVLEGELQGMKACYLTLKDRITCVSETPVPISALSAVQIEEKAGNTAGLGPLFQTKPIEFAKREEYPLVTIWTLEEWNKHPLNKKNDEASIHQSTHCRGRAPASDTETRASLQFIQDQEGNSVTETKAAEITCHAWTLWQYLEKKDLAPPKWNRATAVANNYFVNGIFEFHDDFRLVNSAWKVQKLATAIYPGWYRNRKNKDAVKTEPIDPIDTVSATTEAKATTVPQKCKEPPTDADATVAKPEKAARIDEDNHVVDEGIADPLVGTTDTLGGTPGASADKGEAIRQLVLVNPLTVVPLGAVVGAGDTKGAGAVVNQENNVVVGPACTTAMPLTTAATGDLGPLSVNVVNTPKNVVVNENLNKPFRFAANSNSAVNLFGKEYSATHKGATKMEVTKAFEQLSEAEKKKWNDLHSENLAAKCNGKKTGA
ncbi:hypothetical protein NLJ89_g9100 [Agrocybe chaxingu]|uniref:Uncharacterized protein n=1 Tax=Agrocybe chaxingu TaxID=84603 RepID=A0A9W8MQ68_9AGAR|nr:hypothetical protein NLJ89_g9100 [Agrocybe chaxingu]